MHSEAKSKAEQPQPTGPTPLPLPPPPPPLPSVWGAILVRAKWQDTVQGLKEFIELTDLALHVKFSSLGRLYHVSCESFMPPD